MVPVQVAKQGIMGNALRYKVSNPQAVRAIALILKFPGWVKLWVTAVPEAVFPDPEAGSPKSHETLRIPEVSERENLA
jgi:hypothetical protein